ncbi:MAG: MerR family transcriptional regulator [Treponemataceae bacterium]|nr:MerR family transcriptional regulator [Treponemataceae bacterium]
MASYSIGDVEKILQVKAHVLRYWEREIPLIQPRKDINGRRVYSSRDIRILLRLKYLLYNKRYTIEGAREELIRELSGPAQDLLAHLDGIRSELLQIFMMVHNWTKEDNESLSPSDNAPDP